MEGHAHLRVGERLEALGPPLVLGHDRGTEPAPMESGSNDAEREDLREGRLRFDAQEPTEFPLGRLDDREVSLTIGSRSRPTTSQPVSVDDRHAEERHALFVREGSDLVRVFVLRRPHPETGKELHRASVPESSTRRTARRRCAETSRNESRPSVPPPSGNRGVPSHRRPA